MLAGQAFAVMMLFMGLVTVVDAALTSGADDTDCPVCTRVVRAAKDLATKSGGELKASSALKKYCELGTSLNNEDQKFCYNIENVSKDINRLLDFGADEARVCKKVKAMNPDFCLVKSKSTKPSGVQINERYKRAGNIL